MWVHGLNKITGLGQVRPSVYVIPIQNSNLTFVKHFFRNKQNQIVLYTVVRTGLAGSCLSFYRRRLLYLIENHKRNDLYIYEGNCYDR